MSDASQEQSDRILDDEIVYRRIPSYPPFYKPDNWLTTANFKLDSRRNELGLSVYRTSIRSLEEVLSAVPNSFAVSASVREIRNLTNAGGTPLNLDVLPIDESGTNPGHAEIYGPTPGHLTRSMTNALRNLFAKSGRLTVD
ncbi:MAG: hypothetical protein WD669_13560 [Pirellulales bacterium]